MAEDQRDRVRRLYAGFNARDIDAVLADLTPDVVWANGMEGGHVHGHDGVRQYWTRQFELISSTVEPRSIDVRDDGRAVVDVHQVVRSADGGELLADTTVTHVFAFGDDGLVSRFDIE